MIPRRDQRQTRPRPSRRPWPLAVAVAVVALVVAACGNSSSGGAAIKEGGIYRLGTGGTIDSLNPYVAFNADAWSTFEYIYPALVQYNAKLQFVPDFATSWQESPDGRTWTFHTRPNAKWSDGKPLTAADAAWTFSTDIKFQSGPTANATGVTHMVSAKAPNATTLLVTYKQPVANALSQLQQVPILPEHIWAKYATGNGKALTTFTNPAPIVSGGSFILQKYTPKQIALFKRNPNYYGPKPHIDGLGLQFFQTDDAEITALKAAHFVVRQSPGTQWDDLIINSNPQQDASHKELLNPLLRQAFDDAIDRQQIVKTSLLGHGQPGSTIIPPSTGHWHDPSLQPVAFSLAKANQLLDQAGFKMGPNGVRIADGHPMSYTVIMPEATSTSYGERSFQIIQTGFKKIGVQLNPKNLDDTAAYNAILANNYKSFELSMWDWQALADPDFILSVLACGTYNVWNDTGYCTKPYDGMYQAQGAALNPAKRQQLVYQMQQMAYNQRPYLILDYLDLIEAHSTQWAGLPLVLGNSWTELSKIPFESVHLTG